ncbi:ComEA family DNA-binding protein [Myxosarcina sp. GI1]|uniref:helix-hairpin-helix domain-containing protein n=1 Tax=Myxosarcina sp. GI1 TaxID=1541065 RepID=UPI00056B65FE|nr:ComEA family DNA-binding protein [Myxosarcina sp. GI1]
MFNWSQIGIRNRILNDPYYRFQSLTEVAIAAELGIKINVNQASIDDWLRLPGFSIHQARSLVDLVGMGVQLLCIEDVAAAISLPVQRLKPLEPILQFEYYDRLSPLSPQKVNPNTASLAEIAQIPIVDKTLAEKMVAERQQQGYANLADLQRRLELDGRAIAQLMYYLQF